MKNFVLGAMTVIALGAGAAYAGIFDSLATSDWESVPAKHYKVETYGFDVRVYEFKTKANKDCVMAFAEAGPIGLQCN